MIAQQHGVCAICGCPPTDKRARWCLDHDHATKRLRALLCLGCNMGLGHFKDNAHLLRQAAAYIESHLLRQDDPVCMDVFEPTNMTGRHR